jgi:hypothetical protein
MRAHTLFTLSAAALLSAAPARAQATTQLAMSRDTTPAARDTTTAATPAPERSAVSMVQKIEIRRYRAPDQRGINVFEAPKNDGVPYTGFKLNLGAAFTQQFQGLSHSNTADSVPTSTNPQSPNLTNANRLMDIGYGFNNANANLYLNAQLAPGIRVALTTYLSSRHHNETWVKDGYLLIDESPLDVPVLKTLMEYVTVKAGHFEINYGDAHFRRSDNGNTVYNPFVGNLLLDAFTTEIGGEVYLRGNGLLAMAAVTGGQIRGDVTNPDRRSPAFIGKLGVDRKVSPDLRLRLTGSAYRSPRSPSNTLYAGDRAGSRYYYVVENTQAKEASQFTSGLLNPRFANEVTAFMVNPFLKYRGMELFGVVERTEGRASTEAEKRQWSQYAAEAVYRFLPGEKLFVAGRYNTAKGELLGVADEVGADRTQLGAGWFITPGVLLKGEWVTQQYNDFPASDIRSGGKFDGFVIEGVVAF